MSSGVHQGGHQAVNEDRSTSRFSKETPAGKAEQETLSLQTLAAAADSGVFLLPAVSAPDTSLLPHQSVCFDCMDTST